MNVKKININQSEPSYDIISDAYDITYEESNVGEKLSELEEKVTESLQTEDANTLEISDETGCCIAVFEDGGIKTSKFDSKDAALKADIPTDFTTHKEVQEAMPVIVEGSNSDSFDLVDEMENVVLSVEEGNVKTQNFDSSWTPKARTLTSEGDFDLCDTDGNCILSVNNGHIKTALFDSSKLNKETSSKETSSRIIYVSQSFGSDLQNGSLETPYKTVEKALSIDDAEEIIILGGTYIFDNASAFNFARRHLKITSMPSYRTIFKFGRRTDVSMASENLYECSVDNFNSYENYVIYGEFINAQTQILESELHPLQQGHKYRCEATKYLRYQSMEELTSKTKGYFYDESNHKIIIKSDTSLDHVWFPTTGYIDTEFSDVTFEHIEIYYCSIRAYRSSLKMIDCRVMYPTSPIVGGITYQTSYIYLLRTEVCGTNNANSKNAENTGDGICGQENGYNPYNGKRTVFTATLIDCWVHDNQDDGYSDHGQGTATIIGGLYEYNRKAGLIPVSGVHATIINVTSRHQQRGFSIGNEMYHSSEDDIKMGIELFGCISQNNNYNYRSDTTTGYGIMILNNCISMNASSTGFVTKNGDKMVLRNCKSLNDTNIKDSDFNGTIENGVNVE